MIITEIYKKYKITRSLQEHQLRVAAVARQICDNLSVHVDTESVVKACLIHDMGNIIKFNFKNPEWLRPEGAEYWKKVQKEFKQKYGEDEHRASLSIAKELRMSDRIIGYIKTIDFNKTVETARRSELEPKICDNADLRVGPFGVVTLHERLMEGKQRYKSRPDKWIPPEKWEELSDACYTIEKQVFARSTIKPSDITDESIAPIIEELKAYEI